MSEKRTPEETNWAEQTFSDLEHLIARATPEELVDLEEKLALSIKKAKARSGRRRE